MSVRRGYAVALVVLFVALDAGAYWYLRDRMTNPPSPVEPGIGSAGIPGDGETADPPAITGPVLLAGARDGSVLRATRGDCEEQAPATVWVAPRDTAAAVVEVSGLVEALAVGRTRGDGWLIVGTDEQCEVAAWSTSSYRDTAWHATRVPDEAWYLDPRDATRVRSADGPVALPTGCLADWVQAVGPQVHVVCADGLALRGDVSTETFEAVLTGVAATTVGADGRQAYLVDSPPCPAQLRVDGGSRTRREEHCFGSGKAPLGIAWTGRDLVAQIGFDLVGNASGSWEVRG